MHKQLTQNTILTHYRIVSKIGAGGLGEAYLAQDTTPNIGLPEEFSNV